MNPGLTLLLVAVLLAVGVVIVQAMMNRPSEGWFAWIREAFTSRLAADDGEEVEPLDVSLAELLNEAEEAPEEFAFEMLARR